MDTLVQWMVGLGKLNYFSNLAKLHANHNLHSSTTVKLQTNVLTGAISFYVFGSGTLVHLHDLLEHTYSLK